MIVPTVEFDPWLTIDTVTMGDVHGSVSGLDDREKSDKPRRPIGFRAPERTQPIDPSWMLL